jgi:hypothetical protein
MPSQITETILNLKTEIEKFTASMREEINSNVYKKSESDERYAPKNHAWSGNTDYGTADSSNFGHVKRISEITQSSPATSVPDKQAVTNYLTASLQDFHNTINQEYDTETTGKIEQKISAYNIESKLKRFSIASTYQKPNDYATTGIEDPLAGKIQDNDGVDKYIWAGHYHIAGTRNFTIPYGSLNKSYRNGLLDVRVAGNGITQELYTTVQNANRQWVLSGEKYTRTGTKNENTVNWNEWFLAYMPYSTSEINLTTTGTGIDNMTLKENTSGYIIEWDAQTPYTLEAKSGEEKEIASFNKQLHINDLSYSFSNYVGGFEIKVYKNKVTMISNKQQGSAIDKKHLKQNYFIPRSG